LSCTWAGGFFGGGEAAHPLMSPAKVVSASIPSFKVIAAPSVI